MSDRRQPQVSIVIPTRNAGPILKEVLEALRSQRTDRTTEIVAFDSASTDGTVGLLQEHAARITEISPSEFDHGLTRNQAIAASRGSLVVLLTQDAVPRDEGWLEAMLVPFEDPEVAGVYARQVARADADVLTRRHLETWVTGQHEPRVQRMPDRASFLRLHPMDRYRLCVFDDVCSAVRRSVWERIPYEAAYFGEDLDWGKKALEDGWKLFYQPEAVVVHSHDRSIAYEYRRTYLCHRRLYELFGLRTVPGLGDALRNAVRRSLVDTAFVWRHEPALRRRIPLLLRLPLVSLFSSLAQWRGAADERENRPLPLARGV